MVWLDGSSVQRSSNCGLKKLDKCCGVQECVCLDFAFPFFEIFLNACLRIHAVPNSTVDEKWLWAPPDLSANLGYRRCREIRPHVRAPSALHKTT